MFGQQNDRLGASFVLAGITPTTQTSGAQSGNGVVTITALPSISKAFAPNTIQVGGNSVVTLTLSNANATDLTNASFSDSLTNMNAFGGSVTGTCSGTTPTSFPSTVR